jgi:hypothetical protein
MILAQLDSLIIMKRQVKVELFSKKRDSLRVWMEMTISKIILKKICLWNLKIKKNKKEKREKSLKQ